MNLENISSLLQVRQLPTVLNANFELIQTTINDMLDKFDLNNSSLKLVESVSSVPAGGIAISSLTVVGSTGNLINLIKQNGSSQTTVYTVDANGALIATKFNISGTDESGIAGPLRTASTVFADGGIEVNGVLDLSKVNSVIKRKYRRLNVVDANTGGSAAVPIDLSKDQRVFIDYKNGGNDLANAGALKLATQNMVDGQELELYCLGDNGAGMKLWNGTSGNELFAFINPASGAFTSISYLTLPTFAPSTSPNTQSYMRCMWMNIGSNVFRFVILESARVSGVS